MELSTRNWIAVIAFSLPLAVGINASRSDEPSDGSQGTVPRPTAIEAAPRTMFVRDEDGHLTPVAGLTYERIHELLLLEANSKPKPPTFVFEAFQATGTLDPETQSVAWEVDIALNTRDDDWSLVPIRFVGCALARPVEWPSEIEESFHESRVNGHYLWVKGNRGKVGAKLHFVQPIRMDDGQSDLLIDLPSASMTTLIVNVPKDYELSLSSDSKGLLRKQSTGEGIRFEVIGAGGKVALLATRRPTELGPVVSELQSEVDVQYRIDSPRAVRAEARLSIRGAIPRRFVDVVLPPNMRLVETTATGFQAKVNERRRRTRGSREITEEVVRIDIGEATNGRVEIQLTATLDVTGEASGTLDLSGFDVLEATRQSGSVECLVSGGWLVHFQPGAFLVTEPPHENASGGLRASRYRFSSQPFNLDASITPQQSKTAIESSYTVRIDSNEANLLAVFTCRSRGGREGDFEFELRDWNVVNVTPEILMQEMDTDGGRITRLSFPASLIGSDQNALELRVEATRALPETNSEISFFLPKVNATTLTPATLQVEPADNIALLPNSRSVGIVPETAPSRGPRNKSSLYYRETPYREAGSSSRQSTFAAQMRRRKRSVSVNALASIQLEAEQLVVSETFEFRALYEPLREIIFEVSTANREWEGVQFSFGNQVLPYRLLPDAGEIGIQRLAIDVPDPRVGDLTITSRYVATASDELRNAIQDGSASIVAPLMTPLPNDETTIASKKIEVVAPPLFSLRSKFGPPDVRGSKNQINGARRWEFPWPQGAREFPIEITSTEEVQRGSVDIEKAYIETWLGQSGRSERACFQVVTDEPLLRIILPPGASERDTRVRLNRELVSFSRERPGIIAVTAPPHKRGKSLSIEIASFISMPPSSVLFRHRQLTSARIGFSNQPRSLAWTVTLPASESLFFNPEDYASSVDWAWKNGAWRRIGAETRIELAKWIRVEPSSAPISSGDEYLFKSVSARSDLQLTTFPRSLVWLCGGTAALLVGFLWVYVPALRRATTLLGVAGVVFAFGAGLGEGATLFVQPIAWGLALAVFSSFLARLLGLDRGLTTSFTQNGRGRDSSIKMRQAPRLRQESSRIAIPKSRSSKDHREAKPEIGPSLASTEARMSREEGVAP